MNIISIYENFNIPPNLQLHMLRAAAVGFSIVKHINKKNIDSFIIVQTLLLHDTGNIIKFDLEKFPALLGAEIRRMEYWKQKQREFIAKYGTNEHHAMLAIAKEIGVSSYTLHLLDNMGLSALQAAVETTDYNQKICCYSDFRSGPFGIVNISERFDDLQVRYKGRNHPNAQDGKIEKGRTYCFALEKQIQNYAACDLQKITNNSVNHIITSLQNFEPVIT